MRGFQCYYFHLDDTNTLVMNNNSVCFAGLVNFNGINNIILKEKTKQYIYIDRYIEPEISNEDRQRVISLVNKITFCKIVRIKDKFYIKYKLLKHYDQNLILLNFIRTLWYKPQDTIFNINKFYVDIKKPKPLKQDTLSFMLQCVRDSTIVNDNDYHYGDHCFVYKGIKLKTKKQLLEYTGNSTKNFLVNN